MPVMLNRTPRGLPEHLDGWYAHQEIKWSCRESNPGPPISGQAFYERSSRLGFQRLPAREQQRPAPSSERCPVWRAERAPSGKPAS